MNHKSKNGKILDVSYANVKTLYLFILLLLVACSPQSDKPRISSASNNVFVIDQLFEMPGLNRQRRLRIYLPLNYGNVSDNYPVLYMHDGQNLFDEATSYAGEWGIDESLNMLSKTNGLSIIVVGIDNGQEKRMNELSPWENKDFGKAEGKQYMNFIINTVKPYIDKNYRTLPDRLNTAIMGSSMGGLISHYAIFEYSSVFSKAGIFSPSFWYSEEVKPFSDTNKLPINSRLYFLVGDDEGADMIDGMREMVTSLEKQGLGKTNLNSKTVKHGTHNEAFWRSEFSDAITWLFQNQ